MTYDLPQFKERILKAAFDNNVTPYDCYDLWNELAVGKPIPHLTIDYKFLIRCSYNDKKEPLNNVARLSYNPFPDRISLQRCNYEGQSVFYGAIGLDNDEISMQGTAIVEVCLENIKKEDMDTHYLTMSKWMLTQPLRVLVLPHSPIAIQKNPEMKKAKEHFQPLVEDMARQKNIPIEYVNGYLEFISDLFCMKDNKPNYYKLTSSLVNFLMADFGRQGQHFDGIMYPSANSQSAGINIALHPEVVNQGKVFIDTIIMEKAQRRTTDRKAFDFDKISDEAIILPDGTFSFNHIKW